MPVGFAVDPIFLKHYAPFPHPECPDRLRSIHRGLATVHLLPRVVAIPTRAADPEDLGLCHTERQITRVARTSQDPTLLDADTYTNPDSYAAARVAAGTVMSAVDAVWSGQLRYVFCAVRPPGHHAESDRAMGFCLFNNVAIGARHAIRRCGLRRIMILDWDVHHGNGTQEIFYEDPLVYYISLHQYPLYPGTGMSRETGSGSGRGTTRNFPLPGGTGDSDYLRVWKDQVLPLVCEFDPELVFLSAGFDAHREDPLAQMDLSTEAYGALTRELCDALERTSVKGIVSVLEGGYHLDALAESVTVHILAMEEHAQ